MKLTGLRDPPSATRASLAACTSIPNRRLAVTRRHVDETGGIERLSEAEAWLL